MYFSIWNCKQTYNNQILFATYTLFIIHILKYSMLFCFVLKSLWFLCILYSILEKIRKRFFLKFGDIQRRFTLFRSTRAFSKLIMNTVVID